ncbi:hypothetical protein TNCV_4923881 [Trichonephila clavipes]|nr:hypothetical protein TNCV_4923881 [Trichonephila clavipes]
MTPVLEPPLLITTATPTFELSTDLRCSAPLHGEVTYLPRNDGVHDSPSVPQHENELGVRKETVEIHGRAEAEGVFVTQTIGRVSVASDDL